MANSLAGPSRLDHDKPGLPTTDDVCRALQAQTTPSKKIIKSIRA